MVNYRSLDILTNQILVCNKCPRVLSSRVFPMSHYYGTDDLKLFFIAQNPGPLSKLQQLRESELRNVSTLEVFKQEYFRGLQESKMGAFLNGIFSAIPELSWDNLFFTNVVKCYIDKNKSPNKTEIANCEQFLKHQIDLVFNTKDSTCKLIVAMGSFAFDVFLNNRIQTKINMTQIHAKIFYKEGIFLIPSLHYAYIKNQSLASQRILVEKLIESIQYCLKQI